MKKIPSVFLRDYENSTGRKGESVPVRNEVNPVCAWVAAGEGVATRKWDGQAVLIQDGRAYMRFDAKAGRTPPPGFTPAQPAPDEKSGHWPGWIPAEGPGAKWIVASIDWAKANLYGGGPVPDGTYEAVGPKIGTRHGANPENLPEHVLVPHGKDVIDDAPRDFDGLSKWLANRDIEGLVFWHPDGRMAKIKASDFPGYVPPPA